jgi:hypothetical protein
MSLFALQEDLLRMHEQGRSVSFMRQVCALVVVVSVALSGCKTMTAAEEANLTPAERQMRADADQFNETILGGAATGAIIGALIGAVAGLASGDKQRIGSYAAVGAVGGGILGGVDGYITAKQRETGNNRLRMVNSMTEDVEKDNQRLAGLVNNSKRVLAESRQRLDDVNQQLAQKKITLEQAKAEKSRVEKNRDVMADALDALKKRQDNYNEAGRKTGGTSNPAFNQQVAQLNAQIAQLEQNISGMNDALAVSKV